MKHLLTVECSTPQMHKLRKGRKVRVKHGKGVHLVVKPETYNIAMRAFEKGRGTDLQLDEDELERNLGLTPEEHQELSETHMTGGGIFGPKFDRFLEKHGIRDVAYQVGDKIKPYAKAGAVGAITAGAAGLGGLATFGSGGTLAPLAPYLIPAAAALSAGAVDFIDNPDKYHDAISKVKHMRKHGPNTLEHAEAKAHANNLINEHLGTNYDYMNRAGLQSAGANELLKRMDDSAVAQRYQIPTNSYNNGPSSSIMGYGMHHTRHKKLIEGGTIGLNGNHVNYFPQALVSQPLTANFSMSHFLPPQYQKFNNGGESMISGSGLGTGLYSGGAVGCGIREDSERAYDSVRRGAQDLYSNISPVVKNAFHNADALIHGKGVKEDLRTVGEMISKYDPVQNAIRKMKGKGMKRKIKGKGTRAGEYMTYQDKVNARNEKGYGY